MPLVKSPRMRAADRRQQLLDTTLDLVVDRGFHAVTIEAIAQAAGVTRPIIYKQFDDLPGLVRALVDREEDRAITQLARAIPPRIPGDRDPDDLLVEGLQLFLEAVQEAPKSWRLILLPPEGVPEVFHERTARTRRNVLQQLQKLVEWGIARRGGPILDSELFARFLMEMAEDSARLILTQPEKFTIERIVAFARALIVAMNRPVAKK